MANNQSRNYSRLTIERLYSLSGNRCAFPGCDVKFLNWEDDTNFSNICQLKTQTQIHIKQIGTIKICRIRKEQIIEI